MIIIVFGLPGSGKSFFAERLAEKLDAKRLSTDALRKRRFPDPDYSEQEKMQVYGMLIQAVRLNMRDYPMIILDGTFYKKEIRETFSWTAGKMGDDIKYIEVKADEELIRRRTNNEREESDADYKAYLKVKEEFEPMRDTHLVLKSSDDNIDEMLERAMNYLEHEKIYSF